jgi:hemoglobin-like flavoprotein
MHRVALLLLIGAVALTIASTPVEQCCSAGDRAKVQEQWRGLFADQDARFRAGIARLLLLKVIEENPDAKALFNNVGVDKPQGGEFTAHSLRIFNALDMAINLLDDPESLEEALDHLAEQHQARPGVKKAYFTSFGQALNRGLPKILDKYDIMAWKQCAGTILRKIASRLQA